MGTWEHLFLFMFLLHSMVCTVLCCRTLTRVSSLVFLGSQQRELASGGHFRVLNSSLSVVYLRSSDSLAKAHKLGHFQALEKCCIVTILIQYIDLISKCRSWSDFAFNLFLSRWASQQEILSSFTWSPYF